MLGYIHEYKGQQNLFIEAKADILSHLLEIAKIQSTETSNRIEGIYTSEHQHHNDKKTLGELVKNGTIVKVGNGRGTGYIYNR